MIGAFFYLVGQSWKNRTLMRFRRLKQPKYLVGAIAGGLYLYFYMFRFVLHPNRFGATGWHITPENRVLIESFAAAILGVILLLGWVVPHERAALIFSEAEVAFLFPAPISRRKLIHFKLLKSQVAILFTTLIFTLIFRRSISGSPGWIRAVGWWVIFSTMNLHLIGASFVRTMLMDHGISNWKRRIIVLTLTAMAAGAVLVWAIRTLPPPDSQKFEHLPDVLYYAQSIFQSGPLPYLLYPFRLVVRPYLSVNAGAALLALGPALLLMAAHYWWVVRSNVAFEEASVEASKKMAERIATIRANRGMAAGKPTKKKRAPFKLRPAGLPAVGLLWKNLIAAGQSFTWRFWLLWAWMAVIVGLSSGMMAMATRSATGMNPKLQGVLMIGGAIALMFLIMSFLIGPQLVRQDFRHDLAMADVLKAYPMTGWEVALGELLAPAVILTAVQWLLIILCYGLSAGFGEGVTREMRLALASGVAVIAPGLNAVSLLIPNAAVLFFPGWFHAGKDSPQGIEATGQRLIFALGQLVVFLLALVPAAMAFAVVYFPGRMALGNYGAVPVGALAAAVIMAGEAALGVMLLGKLFERLDLSSESVS
jgi:ABC-2 type transport system permease protein